MKWPFRSTQRTQPSTRRRGASPGPASLRSCQPVLPPPAELLPRRTKPWGKSCQLNSLSWHVCPSQVVSRPQYLLASAVPTCMYYSQKKGTLNVGSNEAALPAMVELCRRGHRDQQLPPQQPGRVLQGSGHPPGFSYPGAPLL